MMLLLHPLLRRKRPCLAPTLEIASHLVIVVERAAVLTNVAGAIDLRREILREIVRSKGVTVVAGGLPLDLDMPRETDFLEMLHPGGEARPHPYHQ
jgi:hypothetical protein